ncbi:hypothetical protein, partial [Micrococcus luteus]|uniref:hypothetical protein n=1 Tax=Micrococcus luteus TaxID=1270 RepID=UPI001C92DFBE
GMRGVRDVGVEGESEEGVGGVEGGEELVRGEVGGTVGEVEDVEGVGDVEEGGEVVVGEGEGGEGGGVVVEVEGERVEGVVGVGGGG